MHSKLLLTLGSALALTGAAAAQGSNACGGAVPIAGEGSFNYSTVGATTDGPGTCNANQDVWFAWTAQANGTHTIETCNTVNYDSYLSAYSGSCGSLSQLDCNDDSCGLQSRISINASNGTTYLLRVGGFGGNTGSGSFQITTGGPTGGCPNQPMGPDVIVGSVSGITNWGGVSGTGSYSLGTTSCNVGDTELNWIANTNDHPVIAQNIYRIEDGALDQIGQSWLKHGFTALQGNLCCDCIASGTGSRLGVGCSDPYGSSLNGSQGRLGPRSEVNAHTGIFTYPHGDQGQGGNDIYKRIQVDNDDVDPAQHPSATFFGETEYIAKDDAAAGNANNNSSWRPLARGSFSDGQWQLSTSGSTRREENPIDAWKEFVPAVQLEEVQIPNEGLFVVGSHVVDNGNGTWTYHYAVFNMNSDRSGQSFSVPIQNGTNMSNVAMNDVDYHSGEPYTNTDWAPSMAGGNMTWETQTFAQNQNANALRWDTTYSFRFTAHAAPIAGSATLGLFKPGTPTMVSVPVQVPDAGNGGPVNYCTGAPNSAGAGANMAFSGSTSIGANNFNISSVGAIPNGFGLFYYGPNQIQVPFGDGFRCVGGNTWRLNPVVQANGAGTAMRHVNFMNPPANAGGGMINSGSTWNFQHWYRDNMAGMSGFNFSDGLSATFQP